MLYVCYIAAPLVAGMGSIGLNKNCDHDSDLVLRYPMLDHTWPLCQPHEDVPYQYTLKMHTNGNCHALANVYSYIAIYIQTYLLPPLAPLEAGLI